jgi:hypothetical protein
MQHAATKSSQSEFCPDVQGQLISTLFLNICYMWLEFDTLPCEGGWDYIYLNDDVQGSEGDM